MSTIAVGARRHIRSRDTRWAAKMARGLAAIGVRPNHISCLSVVFAALSGSCLAASPSFSGYARGIILIVAAVAISLRLLCNLFDGMLAVEGGLSSKSGEIYNDFPDRPSDVLILLGAGYAARSTPGAVELGWATALLAVMTAYVRMLGAAAGAKQYFIGPMAKQHRMAVIISACLFGAVEGLFLESSWTFVVALGAIALGSSMTIVRRLGRIVTELEGR